MSRIFPAVDQLLRAPEVNALSAGHGILIPQSGGAGTDVTTAANATFWGHTGSQTFAFMFNGSGVDVGSTGFRPLIGQDDGGSNRKWCLYCTGTTLRLGLFENGGTNREWIWPYAFTDWDHIMVVINTTASTVTLYVNGVVVPAQTTPAWNGTIANVSYALRLGTAASTGRHGRFMVRNLSCYDWALSATDAVEMAKTGGVVPERFKWRRPGNIITDTTRNSVFTAGATDWGTWGTATATNDAVNQRVNYTMASPGNGGRLTVGYDTTGIFPGKRMRFRGTVGGLTGNQTLLIGWVTGGGPNSLFLTASTSSNGAFDFVVEAGTTGMHPGFRIDGSGAVDIWLDDIVIEHIGAFASYPMNEGAGLQIRDESSNRIHGVLPVTNASHLRPVNGPFNVRTTTNTSGNQQLCAASCVPTNCQVLRVRARTQSGTSTASLGNASGGAQIVSSAALTTTWQVLTIVGGSHITSTNSLWAVSNNTNTIEWDIQLEQLST